MKNFTTATVEGHVSQDPVIKQTKNGKSLCTFSVAINHLPLNDSEPQVSFIEIETWGKLADFSGKYIRKGKHVLINGSLKQDRWTGQDKKPHSKLKIIGSDIQLLSAKKNLQTEEKQFIDQI